MKNIYNSPVNIRFVAKISDIRNLFENIRFDVKTSEVATPLLNPGAPNCNRPPNCWCQKFSKHGMPLW